MTGIVGSTWEMRDSLTDIAWTARTPLSEVSKAINDPLLTVSWQRQVRKALAEDLAALPTAPDVYGFGKECARTARFALIADELGEFQLPVDLIVPEGDINDDGDDLNGGNGGVGRGRGGGAQWKL